MYLLGAAHGLRNAFAVSVAPEGREGSASKKDWPGRAGPGRAWPA